MRREAEGLAAVPGDPWATREFRIKWKRYSYIHCSWDLRATLEQLPGFKRVINYMRRVRACGARASRGLAGGGGVVAPGDGCGKGLGPQSMGAVAKHAP